RPAPDPTGTIPIQPRSPFPNYGVISTSYNGGWSSYEAMTVRVEKRFSAGSYLLGAYTWGHAFDLGTTDEGSASASAFKVLDKGSTQADVRQRLVLSYLWELPIHGSRLVR